jgi:hypothetical protein
MGYVATIVVVILPLRPLLGEPIDLLSSRLSEILSAYVNEEDGQLQPETMSNAETYPMSLR